MQNFLILMQFLMVNKHVAWRNMLFQQWHLHAEFCFQYCTGSQTPRPLVGNLAADPSRGHLQDALLSLGTAHTHFGHVQVTIACAACHLQLTVGAGILWAW